MRERFDAVAGVTVRSLEAGPQRGDAPHVVLLPGLGALGYLLPTVRAVARRGATCTLLDLPGFGGSRPWPAPPTVRGVAAATAAWVLDRPPPPPARPGRALHRRAGRAPRRARAAGRHPRRRGGPRRPDRRAAPARVRAARGRRAGGVPPRVPRRARRPAGLPARPAERAAAAPLRVRGPARGQRHRPARAAAPHRRASRCVRTRGMAGDAGQVGDRGAVGLDRRAARLAQQPLHAPGARGRGDPRDRHPTRSGHGSRGTGSWGRCGRSITVGG